jgi:cobalt-zinc-cadmium efflux system protein
MEGVPPHLNPVEIEAAMRTAHGVRAVHDLHVWTLTSGRDALSAHVLVEDISDGQHVLGDLQALLRQRFGIEHVTIQLESDRSPLIQVGPGDVPNPQASGRTAPVTDRRPVREDHG